MVHGVPIARNLGKSAFGTRNLEVGNEGIETPSVAKWLGWATDAKARFKQDAVEASSVGFAVLGGSLRTPPKERTTVLGLGCNVISEEI